MRINANPHILKPHSTRIICKNPLNVFRTPFFKRHLIKNYDYFLYKVASNENINIFSRFESAKFLAINMKERHLAFRKGKYSEKSPLYRFPEELIQNILRFDLEYLHLKNELADIVSNSHA